MTVVDRQLGELWAISSTVTFRIRKDIEDLRRRASEWEPRPMPRGWEPTP